MNFVNIRQVINHYQRTLRMVVVALALVLSIVEIHEVNAHIIESPHQVCLHLHSWCSTATTSQVPLPISLLVQWREKNYHPPKLSPTYSQEVRGPPLFTKN